MRIAVLGLGEAGSTYSTAFAERGHDVVGFDPRGVEGGPGVTIANSVSEAVTGAELVLGLTTAAPSVDVAREAAAALAPHAVFVDLNAASPQRKREVGAALGESVKLVDGAVIGSVTRYGAQVKVLLSGPHADEAADALRLIDADVEPIGGAVGDASQRKLLRSVFMKGLGALITEAVDAGEATGEPQWMRDQISAEITGGEGALDRLFNGTRTHALRRSLELEDSLDLLEGFPGEWPMTTAAVSVHHERARASEADLSTELTTVPTSAIGDAGDRLGFLHSSVKPIWKCPPLAGRVFTVHTRPGDNQAIHRALQRASPGDVLVVDGGGHTERALIGELIAERAQKKGIAGMVIDGAVRDVDELAQLGFPVWAAGVSPAGPYKDGPGRLGGTISIAGAVCHHRDYIVADADGAVVVPAVSAERTLVQAQAVVTDERRRQQDIRSSAPAS